MRISGRVVALAVALTLLVACTGCRPEAAADEEQAAPDEEEAVLVDLELGASVTLVALIPGSSPVWLPDSARLVHLGEAARRVEIFNLKTGETNAVCELPAGRSGYEGLVSAGGSAILASNGDALYAIDLDRGSMERLTAEPSRSYRDAIRAGWYLFWASPPVFDTRSRLIAFAANRSPRESLVETVDCKGTQILTLSDASEPAWVEGGRAIVYTRATTPDSGSPSYHLRYHRLAGGTEALLFPGSAPVASPDGSRLCYTAEGGLRVWNLADKTTQPVTIRGSLLAWSPDGKSLLVMAHSDSTVFSVELAPDRRVFIMRHPDVHGKAAWSPDGSQVAVELAGRIVVLRLR